MRVAGFGQYDPEGHWDAEDELTGHDWPNTHRVGEVEPDGQYVPASQSNILLVLLQNAPPGQGLLVGELTGQYWPKTHGLGAVDRARQYVPAGHTAIMLVFWQNHPAGQEVSDTDPAGQ